MSSVQYTEALFNGISPRFPSVITQLNESYDSILVNGDILEEIASKVRGFVGKNQNSTSDGYRWFYILEFHLGLLGRKKVFIAIPWSQDDRKEADSAMDRSIAVYAATDVPDKQVIELIKNFDGSIKEYRKRKLQVRIEEYRIREFASR